MTDPSNLPVTAFHGHRRLRSGALREVALAVKAIEATSTGPVLVFDDETGRVIDLDLRGSETEILRRLEAPPPVHIGEASDLAEAPKGRGRPRLGVVPREVTLLPRHWAWLAGQSGGASAALRRLVDEARRRPDPRARQRSAREAAYRFMLAIAGDMPGYEEATRALFAGDQDGLAAQMRDWPADVRAHVLALAHRADAADEA